MDDEKVLCESRTLRGTLASRTDALDRVKALAVLPDGLHVTTEMVAAYFVVHRDIVSKVTQRHRKELAVNGLVVLRGADLQRFKRDILSLYPGSYPQPPANLTLYTRRTVLNIAMLLRDSEVAREVRRYLLEVEEAARGGALEPRVRNLESAMAEVGPALRELGPVLHRMSTRLECVEHRMDAVEHRVGAVERRVENTERIMAAMSRQLADIASDVKEIRYRPHRLPRRSG
ncbi:hypothetical protein RM780_24200 [Streptomyces sp. DSM 44917]|uniref:Phage protein n=1 Tax=Streptomyces boetiae TaxID=3075541 RepID=A0ABU2LET1_9ACTN|nr:hypothetical protein [Streptomyces sp. DSM 44917]MDT0310032.1 hypothetical protein [Streptomyces sp. DSM 44917]